MVSVKGNALIYIVRLGPDAPKSKKGGSATSLMISRVGRALRLRCAPLPFSLFLTAELVVVVVVGTLQPAPL